MGLTNHGRLIDCALEHVAQAIDIALTLKLATQELPPEEAREKLKELETMLGDAHYTLRFINDSLERRLKQERR